MSVPDASAVALVCMSCEHWQCDMHPRAIPQLGGRRAALMALAQVAADEHGPDSCPGAGDRVKFRGQWVEKPNMDSGEKPTGMLAAYPLPRWWVWR